MQKAIVKDIFFLQQKSAPATKDDLFLAQDLQDTLLAHRESCVGLAANMTMDSMPYIKIITRF